MKEIMGFVGGGLAGFVGSATWPDAPGVFTGILLGALIGVSLVAVWKRA